MEESNRGMLWAAAGAAFGFWAVRRMMRTRYSFADRICIITGGSRGLGLIMGRQLAEQGAHVVLLARDGDELRRARSQLSAGDHMTIACDVTDEQAVMSAVRLVVDAYGRIDVLINNAGRIQVGPIEHMTVTDFDDAIDVHMKGPLHTILAVTPTMRQQGEGRIVNVASIGGKVAFPHLLPYTASKHGLVGMSRGFGHELARYGIRVTTVIPGLMRTGSPRNAMFKGRHRREHAWFALGDSLPLVSMDAERSARQILEAVRRGDASVTTTFKARLAAVFDTLFPDASAGAFNVVARLLPSSIPGTNGVQYSGHESQSALAPSFLTALGDRAAARNNE